MSKPAGGLALLLTGKKEGKADSSDDGDAYGDSADGTDLHAAREDVRNGLKRHDSDLFLSGIESMVRCLLSEEDAGEPADEKTASKGSGWD